MGTIAKNPLSNEFKVAAEIYACKENGELIWYTKLVRGLSDKLSKNTTAHALDTLFDRGIVKTEYGETETDRAGKLPLISNEVELIVRDPHLNFWKDN